MDKYYALIEGNKFFVELDGQKTIMGFFTTFYFEGSFEYKNEVLSLIDFKLKERVAHNGKFFIMSGKSFFYLKSLSVLEEFPEESERVEDGFTLFKLSKFQLITTTLKFHIKNILFQVNCIDFLKKPFLFQE